MSVKGQVQIKLNCFIVSFSFSTCAFVLQFITGLKLSLALLFLSTFNVLVNSYFEVFILDRLSKMMDYSVTVPTKHQTICHALSFSVIFPGRWDCFFSVDTTVGVSINIYLSVWTFVFTHSMKAATCTHFQDPHMQGKSQSIELPTG